MPDPRAKLKELPPGGWRLNKHYHPMVGALYLDLDAWWRVQGGYADPGPRLIQALAYWVKNTGKHQVPTGPWWEQTITAVRSVLRMVVPLDAEMAQRLTKWL